MDQKIEVNDKQAQNLLIFLCVFLSCAALIIWGCGHLAAFKTFFSNTSYYFILALFLSWSGTLIYAIFLNRSKIIPFFKRNFIGIVLSSLIASFIFLTVAHQHRVLSDETNLLSMARNMTLHHKIDNIIQGYWDKDRFVTTYEAIDQRPLMFPFFIHVLHKMVGYNPDNIFLLNYLSFFGLLLSIYLIIRVYLTEILACAALILIAAHPMLSLVATSGCFDILNLFFLAITFLSLRWYLATSSSISLQLLTLNLLMLTNVRYESILVILGIFIPLFLYKKVKLENLSLNPFYLLVPILLLPYLEQRFLTAYENATNFHEPWVRTFGLEHIWNNLCILMKYLLETNGSLGFAGWINGAGLAAFVCAIYLVFIKRRSIETKEQIFLLAILLSTFLVFIVPLAFGQGNCNFHPLQSRYYLLEVIILSILPVFILFQIITDNKRISLLFLLLSISLLTYYHPIAMKDKITSKLLVVKKDMILREFLEKNAEKHALTIFERPGQLVAHNHGAISFSAFMNKKEEILKKHKNHQFSSIFVVQEIAYKDLSTKQNFYIEPLAALKVLFEKQIISKTFLRISQVIPNSTKD